MRRVCDSGEFYQRNAFCVHKGAGMILAVFTVNVILALCIKLFKQILTKEPAVRIICINSALFNCQKFL